MIFVPYDWVHDNVVFCSSCILDHIGPLLHPVYFDPSIWARLFWPVYFDPDFWTHIFGYLDPSFWILGEGGGLFFLIKAPWRRRRRPKKKMKKGIVMFNKKIIKLQYIVVNKILDTSQGIVHFIVLFFALLNINIQYLISNQSKILHCSKCHSG